MTTVFWFLIFLGVLTWALLRRTKYSLYAVPAALFFIAPPVAAAAFLFLVFG
jgi:hypothetical protein